MIELPIGKFPFEYLRRERVVPWFLNANDRDHPARAVDSTQVKTADRGLGVHRLVTPFSLFRVSRFFGQRQVLLKQCQ